MPDLLRGEECEGGLEEGGSREERGALGGHISFDLFQKVLLITFLLPLLQKCFNLCCTEQDMDCSQIKPDRVFPPSQELCDTVQLSRFPPLVVFWLLVFVSKGLVMNDRLIALRPTVGLPQAISAKLLCLIGC